jgi:hypothetical protein
MAEMASFTIDHVVLLIGLSLLYFPRQRLRCGGARARRNERQLQTADKNDFDSSVRRLISLLAKQHLIFLKRRFWGF